MITECALLQVKAGQSAAFELAFKQATPLLQRARGYRAHRLEKCLERDNKYLLLVDWETVQDHTEGFRMAPDYITWKALLHKFYEPFPIVEHYFAIQ